MLGIAPSTVLAFERRHEAGQGQRFGLWWAGMNPLLPPLDPQALESLLAYAQGRAGDLGVEDNSRNTLYLSAAAWALMPQMTDAQFLLAADAVFRHADDRTRVAELVRISQGGGVTTIS